ncbi:MAG TPA: o-succinylbenzoate synthase [Acidimicrobiia bacterium]
MSELLEALELHPVRIPMRHPFRRVDHREAVLIKGPEGWGEFSPFPDYPPQVTARWLASALESACSPLPSPVRERIPVNVTVPVVPPETAAALVRESGASTAKVKVGDPGTTIDEDEERLDAVVDALGPGGRIRIDVNAVWTLEEATKALEHLSRFDFEYVEQPVATIAEMVELRRRVGVRLAADELIRLSPNPLEVTEQGACDVVIVKVQPMGGVARVMSLINRIDLPVVVSSALETSVGIYGGLLVASLIDDLPYACGLATVSLLQGDPTPHPLVSVDGFLDVRRVEPERVQLMRWAPDRELATEMMRRLRSAAELLT